VRTSEGKGKVLGEVGGVGMKIRVWGEGEGVEKEIEGQRRRGRGTKGKGIRAGRVGMRGVK